MFWAILGVLLLGWVFVELGRCCYRYSLKEQKRKNKKRKK